jgi:hypothetical protein
VCVETLFGSSFRLCNMEIVQYYFNISTILYVNHFDFSHNFEFTFYAPVMLTRVFVCPVIIWCASLRSSWNFCLFWFGLIFTW